MVTRFMNGGGGQNLEVDEMRKRVSELGELARLAVNKGGSSYVNVDNLITDLSNHRRNRRVVE